MEGASLDETLWLDGPDGGEPPAGEERQVGYATPTLVLQGTADASVAWRETADFATRAAPAWSSSTSSRAATTA